MGISNPIGATVTKQMHRNNVCKSYYTRIDIYGREFSVCEKL